MKKALVSALILLMAINMPLNKSFAAVPTMMKMDMVLVLDTSGSMKENDPNGIALDALNLFADLLSPGVSNVGVVCFSRTLKTAPIRALRTNSDKEALKSEISAIGSIGYSGATDIGLALREAKAMLDSVGTYGASKTIVLLSDGAIDLPAGADRTNEDSERDVAKTTLACENDGTAIFCLGLNGRTEEKYDSNLLMSISEATGGKFVEVFGADALPGAYRDIFAKASGSAVIPVSDYTIQADKSVAAFSVVSIPRDNRLDLDSHQTKNSSDGLYRNQGNSYSMIQLSDPLSQPYGIISGSNAQSYILAHANFTLHFKAASSVYSNILSGYSIWLEDLSGNKIEDPDFLSANALESVSILINNEDRIDFGSIQLPLNGGPDIDMSAYPNGANVQAMIVTKYLDDFTSNSERLSFSAIGVEAKKEGGFLWLIIAILALGSIGAFLAYRNEDKKRFKFGTIQLAFSTSGAIDTDSEIVWKLAGRSYSKKSVSVSEMVKVYGGTLSIDRLPLEKLQDIRFFRKGEGLVMKYPSESFQSRGAKPVRTGEAEIRRRTRLELYEKKGSNEPLIIRIHYF